MIQLSTRTDVYFNLCTGCIRTIVYHVTISNHNGVCQSVCLFSTVQSEPFCSHMQTQQLVCDVCVCVCKQALIVYASSNCRGNTVCLYLCCDRPYSALLMVSVRFKLQPDRATLKCYRRATLAFKRQQCLLCEVIVIDKLYS